MSSSPDIPAALAKMTETALSADLEVVGIGQLLIGLFYIDRVHAAGFLTDGAGKCLTKLADAIEKVTGHPVKTAPEYLWLLACRYGRMATHASTPSKQEIIYHAFFSEFDPELSKDADNAIFRELVEKLDYNEAVLLAGLWVLRRNVKLSEASPDYHVARRLLARGELYVAVVKEHQTQVHLSLTQALGKFIQFIKLQDTPPLKVK